MAVKKGELNYGNKPVESGGGKQILGFEPVCLMPFEPKLISLDLLNFGQKAWLNDYNNRIRKDIGAELKRQKKSKRYLQYNLP